MAYACRENDVNTYFAGGPTPGREVLSTPKDFELLDYDESPLTPPNTSPNRRADSTRKVLESPSIVQLARDRLRRSFNETEGVDRIENVMTHRGRSGARAGGGNLVIIATKFQWLHHVSGVRQHR